ncbi:endoplasmic reticulum junction formation protein lunapark-B-like [Watersipora subatra]|uniref:endoplasmic reticulum junction formation protein lunapark-B-like n=1 Tax=Watersipora subatra TaxID=2589382 RepID=UPI00355C5A05
MGGLFSRFRKVENSPGTKLENINKEIAEIEAYRRQNLALQKKAVASLVIYSILIYLVCSILYFVYYFPVLSTLNKFIHSLPLLIFPILVYLIKKFLHWYFVKRITENDLKVADLKEKKNKIIEDVMENETYKKATEILEKYAPNRLHKLTESRDNSVVSSPNANSSRVQPSSPGTELRLRGNAANVSTIGSGAATPLGQLNRTLPGQTPVATPGFKPTMQQRSFYGAAPGPPLPRQVLPRDRTYMDKIFESLVGDGPQNRFALICRHCKSHNGMALPEEFEFLSFRCCYCFNINEARKQRPNAPRLNLDTTVGSSTDEEGSELESDEETEETEGETVEQARAERGSTTEEPIGSTGHINQHVKSCASEDS